MDEPVVAYQIVVQGAISERWYDWFADLTIHLDHNPAGKPITILCGPVADQSALRGILERIWDLNLALLSVGRLETGGEKENHHE